MLISTVLVGLYLGGQTRERFLNIDKHWQAYSGQAVHRGQLLSRLRAHLGYGGFIHNFKNYVLRKDPGYLKRLEEQLAHFESTVKEYQASGASPRELRHLKVITETIEEYKSKIDTAKRAARENWSPDKTDALVKVDDTGAIQAILALDIFLQGKRAEAAKAISDAVAEGNQLVRTGFFFAGALAVVAIILYGMFFLLQRELQQTISALSAELNERRAAELEAKKFQRAVEQSPATIVITDTSEIIEYVNIKFCELTGYSPEEVLGKTPRILQSGDTSRETYRSLSEQLKKNEDWHGTFRNLKKDGSSYWAKTSILPLRNDVGEITHLIGLGEDITAQREASEHIKRAQKMEAVGLLASGVAHDFNNVLTTILGNVHLAMLDAPEEGEFSEELEQIEIAAKRARHLVGQVLAFARRQPGKAVSMKVGDLMHEVARLIRASTRPDIKLVCNIEDSELSVLADPTRLHQVLMNLCSNAVEAIGAASGMVELKLVRMVGEDTGNRHVCISVSDDGPGIPTSVRDEIFTPFFTTKKAGKGTGLGLSVVASLVDEMNGEISVESTPGKGCSFHIVLPEIQPVSGKDIQPGVLVHGTGEILLVDDEAEVVETCANILRRANYLVETFTDPKAAVAAFEKMPDRFDLVITDFVMPEISGEDVCRVVRNLRPQCPIILYSAYQPGKFDFSRYEPIQFVEKPFEPVVLSATVKSMLES